MIATSLLLFSDKPELFIPQGRGMTHTMQMVRELLTHKPGGKQTSISTALEYLGRVAHRRSIVFLLSDFYDPDFFDQIKLTARRHEVVGMYLYDPIEKNLPKRGIISFTDSETGKTITIDSSSKKIRAEYEKRFTDRQESLKTRMRKYGCDFLSVDISEEYIGSPFKIFFREE